MRITSFSHFFIDESLCDISKRCRVKGGKFGLRQFWTEVGQFWTFGYNLKNIFKSAIKSNLIQLCILGVYIDPIFYYKIPNFSS